MLKNVAGQGVYLYAYTISTSLAKTGDAANITGHYTLNGAAGVAFATANPTEIGGGLYWQPLAQAETDADVVGLYWASSTGGVNITPLVCPTTVGLADAYPHGGMPGSSTATLAAKAMNVTNPAGTAFTAQSTGGDGHGVLMLGEGGGSGIRVTGGNTFGAGIDIRGGTGAGGLYCEGNGGGAAAYFYVPSGDVIGLWSDDGNGLSVTGNGAGKHGIFATGGTNGDGFNGVGNGTGVGFRSVAGAVGFGGAAALPADGLDSVVIEAGLNARQALSIIAAACAGASSGVAAGSPVYKGAGVATTRITATAAAGGDRSGVTLSPPA